MTVELYTMLKTSAEAIAHLKDRKAKGKVVINF